jgi:hypothetical protein
MIMSLKTEKYDHRLEPRKSRMHEYDSYESFLKQEKGGGGGGAVLHY